MEAPARRYSGRQEQERVDRLERSHDLPVGACGNHTDAGRYHGDTSVAGFSEGDWPHSRSDQRIRTGSQDVKEKNKLATKLPPGVTHPAVGPRQLLRVETEIYGLVSGPSWLRASLTVDLLAAGYVKNPYDKCLFTLFSSVETSEGQLLLDVDDFIEGGKETHRKTMEGFYDKYRCGKAVDLMSAGQEGTLFAGRRVVQNPDFRITVSMDEYVKSKLRPIEVPKGYLSNTKERSDGMLTNIKGVNGGLGWLASTERPRVASPHSIIPSGCGRGSPQLISKVNAAVKQCHAVPITITIWPILFAELRWTTFTDSGFDTGERQRHQQGWLVCATNKYFKQERSAPVSVLHWRSRKLTRKAGSPHLVETYPASSAVVEMTWIKALWGSMTWEDFDILTQRRSSRPLNTMMPQVIRNANPAYYNPESTLVMDSKGLFDALDNDLPQDDWKSALEVPIIEEFMRRAMCRPR